MSKSILTFLALIIYAVSSNAQGQKDPAALTILEGMSKRYKSYPSFQAEFTNTLVNPDKSEEAISGKATVKGEMYKLELGEQTVINNGVYVWTYLEEVNEVNVTDYYPEDQEVTLSNIFTIYEDGYKYLYVEEKEGLHVIDLEPEAQGRDIYKIRMEISNESELKSFTMFERSGVKYIYAIENFNPDKNISDEFFEFDEDDYPGVEVIDFRN